MEEVIFKEIANGIKAIHNGALGAIRKKEYPSALDLYRRGLLMTEKIGYDEGSGQILYNLSNLLVLMGDPIQALECAAKAREKLAGETGRECGRLLSFLAVTLKKQGVAYERKGDFTKATACYVAAIPYADEKSRKAMEHEVELLKKYIK